MQHYCILSLEVSKSQLEAHCPIGMNTSPSIGSKLNSNKDSLLSLAWRFIKVPLVIVCLEIALFF